MTDTKGLAKVAAMDTMKLLLGATVAVLLGALVVSWQGMNSGVKNASQDELSRLEKQNRELMAEQQKVLLEKQRQLESARSVPSATDAELAATKAQLEAAKAELDKQNADRDKKLARDEEGLVEQGKLESKDKELARARWIANALVMGKVTEYVGEGNFIIFAITPGLAENVAAGTTVAIRRKTGILGEFKVTEVTPEGAIANPLANYGPIDPKPGDEIILPPQD